MTPRKYPESIAPPIPPPFDVFDGYGTRIMQYIEAYDPDTGRVVCQYRDEFGSPLLEPFRGGVETFEVMYTPPLSIHPRPSPIGHG